MTTNQTNRKVSKAKENGQKTSKSVIKTDARKEKELKGLFQNIANDVEYLTSYFMEDENITNDLTGKDRLRLFSAGVRNNGFIDKAFDIARDNPSFLPPNFNSADLEDSNNRLEELRQLMLSVQKLLRLTTNSYIMQADVCYRDALRIYGSLREQNRGKVPGAYELFAMLKTYFRRKRNAGAQPTERQLEIDVRKLIHGKADGEIVIHNEQPKLVGGVHTVVDSIRTGHTELKETEEAKAS